jgi:hypothetical protein
VSVLVGQRVLRPYPPGNVEVDGVSAYLIGDAEHPEPVLSWTHRDRKLQADAVLGHEEGSVGPELGTTYNIRVYAPDETTLLRETDVGLTDTWTYDLAMQGEDGGPDRVWIELESVRDDLASYFHYRFKVVLASGWGYGWGENWGGY